MLKLSRETRQDPSQTGKLRKEFADSLIRVFKYHAADIGEQSSRPSTTVDKYLRQGYLAGQIYSAVVLKLYKPPFKPMVDEDSLLNIIADAQITLDDMLNGVYRPEQNLITVLTTRLMSAFNRGVVDFSHQHGTTTFSYLAAANCSGECDIENGATYSLTDILAGRCPPIHEGCQCVLIPIVPAR